jgi:hypothetical protein
MGFGDDDDYSPFEGIWAMLSERFGYLVPLWIARQPEQLTILDYRPTYAMLFTAVGFLLVVASVPLLYFGVGWDLVNGLWMLGIPGLACGFLLLRGTIREAYYFDKPSDSYTFVRQFIHRREVIEGSLSQFTGAYVKTESDDDGENYYVILKQEGMFLTGVTEQTLREELPIFNSYDREASIAHAISSFLHAKPDPTVPALPWETPLSSTTAR